MMVNDMIAAEAGGEATPDQYKASPNAIDEEQELDRARAALRFKVLCLGAGESGKSTVIKQLRLIHNGKMSEADIRPFISVLHENTLQCMCALVKAANKFGLHFAADDTKLIAAAERVAIAGSPDNMPEEFIMSPELADDIVLLWAHPIIQTAFSRRHEFWILDGAEYYFDRIKEATAPGFLPSEEDVIMARARTTGIITTEVAADDLTWQVVDVGGQRSERKKWINCFDDVKAVLFVVNLSGYNSVLFEDEKRNRMIEAIDLFEQVTAEPAFKSTPMFLFFNKKDLFEAQLRKTSLKTCFPDYDGKEAKDGSDADTNEAIAFITKKFLAATSPKRDGPPVLTWPIAARFKKDVQYAFQELREQIINQNKQSIKKAQMTVKSKSEKKT